MGGSPPQVRGKVSEIRRSPYAKGITPAGAGKRPYKRILISFDEDHPRRCGEKDLEPYTWVAKIGSPPQVRGKVG